MGTWVGLIVETKGRTDFWDVARNLGVEAVRTEVPEQALIVVVNDFTAQDPLAEAFSRELSTRAISFLAQTAADAHAIQVYANGLLCRKLTYSADFGGWLHVEGEPQPWEKDYFFDGQSADGQWPDMLDNELSETDIARYEAARIAGDAGPVMDLLHPSSFNGLERLCGVLGVDSDAPVGTWKKPRCGRASSRELPRTDSEGWLISRRGPER